jgi:hypothetical protein
MKTKTKAKLLAAGVGLATASYATYAGVTWCLYGSPKRACRGSGDALLDMFMPNYEVADRHKISVAAPPEIALSAASEIRLEDCMLIRAIFKGRELVLGSEPDRAVRPTGLLEEVKSLGWGVLAELPGREIVLGGVTKPWEPNPVFRALPPDEFAAFQEPGYVKIAWTLRTNPDGIGRSIFRTETRAVATDVEARRKFRRYWAFLSPGIIAIRSVMLPAVKAEAERRWIEIAA